MSVRDWMNNNSTVVTVGAIVLLVGALGLLGMQYFGGSSVPSSLSRYYYDTASNTIFQDETSALPPIEAPSGEQTGVRAHIFACGACPSAGSLDGATPAEVEEAGAFIAWLEQFNEQARAAAESQPDNPIAQEQAMQVRENGHFVKRLEDEQWVPAQQALAPLHDQLPGRCGGETPEICRPGS